MSLSAICSSSCSSLCLEVSETGVGADPFMEPATTVVEGWVSWCSS